MRVFETLPAVMGVIQYFEEAVVLSNPDVGCKAPVDSEPVVTEGENAHQIDDNDDCKRRSVGSPQQLGLIGVLLDLRCDVDQSWR